MIAACVRGERREANHRAGPDFAICLMEGPDRAASGPKIRYGSLPDFACNSLITNTRPFGRQFVVAWMMNELRSSFGAGRVPAEVGPRHSVPPIPVRPPLQLSDIHGLTPDLRITA